jgi:hypothetical protein
MALPATGAISLSQIQAEFGGAQPISISEYYRGGVNVPAVSTTTTIPASGTISFDQFHGEADTAPSLLVSINPTSAYGVGTGTPNTNNVTAGVSGGTAPYTYSWTRLSGDIFTVSAATSATTRFSISVGINDIKTAVYKCTVTDNLGVTGFDTVGVEVDWDNGL